jgi:uncharacterized membrane protein
MFHLFKRKILTLKNNREKQQQLQKKEQDNVGVHGFIVFFQNYNHIKAETADEAMFMSTREHILLEEVSRCSLYLR